MLGLLEIDRVARVMTICRPAHGNTKSRNKLLLYHICLIKPKRLRYGYTTTNPQSPAVAVKQGTC